MIQWLQNYSGTGVHGENLERNELENLRKELKFYRKKYEKEVKEMEIVSEDEEPLGQEEQKSIDDEMRKKQHEIYFVVNSVSLRFYIQSAFSIDDEMKRQQEIKPLLKTKDSFRKIVIVNGMQQKQSDEFGIDFIGIIPFLLDENII